jgi:hypothetical protein
MELRQQGYRRMGELHQISFFSLLNHRYVATSLLLLLFFGNDWD